MQSERQQLLHQIHSYLGRPNPTVGEQLLDHLAFALMGLVALIDRRVWSARRQARVLNGSRFAPRYATAHDGWKATRYV